MQPVEPLEVTQDPETLEAVQEQEQLVEQGTPEPKPTAALKPKSAKKSRTIVSSLIPKTTFKRVRGLSDSEDSESSTRRNVSLNPNFYFQFFRFFSNFFYNFFAIFKLFIKYFNNAFNSTDI